MYHISCQQKYQSSLDILPLEVRLSELIHSNKKNIIYVKEVFENSTFRYRTYNVMEAMKGNSKYHVTCFNGGELSLLMKYIEKVDLVILQRCKWSFELGNFIHYIKEHKILVYYDMDDLIYDPKYVPDYLNNTGYYDELRMDMHFAMAARYQQIAKMCDGFLVTTEKLQEKISQDFHKKAFIYYNFLNQEQESIAQSILEIKENTKDRKKFIIGYFSGSNSHARDLEMVEDAIVRLMEKYDDIYLNIVGYMNLSKNFKKLKEQGRIIISPFVTYQELEYLIARVDVNIIPLQKNEFNDCKSELKYFEASIVNTVTVACNNCVYSSIIEDGVNGFLAGELEWFEKLEYVYLNYNRLNDIIKNAREYCLDKYGNSNQEKMLEKLYDNVLEM